MDGKKNDAQPRPDRSRYVSDALASASNHTLSAVLDSGGGGVVARAGKPIRRCECIITCCAASIAIDPMYRRSRCAYCAQPCDSEGAFCEQCGIVRVCTQCKSEDADQWHEKSGECISLLSLVRSFCNIFGLLERNGDNNSTSSSVDSSYVITVRLLHRRWYDDTSKNEKDPKGAHESSSPSPLPPVDWKLFDSLHKTKVSGGQYDAAITALCQQMRKSLSTADGLDTSWITKDAFDDALGRVVGCGHAVVDVTLDIGFQTLGRALFLEHSFYNHACNPNAFISSVIGGPPPDAERTSQPTHRCALLANVHCLSDIGSGEDVTLSYIPTSGMDRAERRKLLKDGYHFECQCRACRLDEGDSTAERWHKCLNVPDGSDLTSLREVHHSCAQFLLKFDGENSSQNNLNACIGMICLSRNGIKNQGVASSHECSVEIHRLLAMAYSLSGQLDEAIKEHEAFFDAVKKISDLFDPIALATQRIEYAFVLHKKDDLEGEKRELAFAVDLSRVALGLHHPYTERVAQKLAALAASLGIHSKSALATADGVDCKRRKLSSS